MAMQPTCYSSFCWYVSSQQSGFAMKDLGTLHHFLGVTVVCQPLGLLLHQRQYSIEILERAGMADCKPCSTPVDASAKLSATAGDLVLDPTDFRSLAGALQYFTFICPDISYAVQQVCLHMHNPREPHLTALKRILRYVRGTLYFGIHIQRAPCTDLVVYSDADWAGCPDTRKSTFGYAVFLGDSLVSGLQSGRTLSLVPVQRLNTGLLQMLLPKQAGYVNS